MYSELEKSTRNINDILAMLPHRYPFFFIDRIVGFKAGSYLTAIKNISLNEDVVISYLPGRPIFPPSLLLEVMAQASGLLAVLSTEHISPDSHFFLIGLDHVRFLRVLEPGSQLKIHVEVVRVTQSVGKFKAQAIFEGESVANAELMCAVKM